MSFNLEKVKLPLVAKRIAVVEACVYAVEHKEKVRQESWSSNFNTMIDEILTETTLMGPTRDDREVFVEAIEVLLRKKGSLDLEVKKMKLLAWLDKHHTKGDFTGVRVESDEETKCHIVDAGKMWHVITSDEKYRNYAKRVLKDLDPTKREKVIKSCLDTYHLSYNRFVSQCTFFSDRLEEVQDIPLEERTKKEVSMGREDEFYYGDLIGSSKKDVGGLLVLGLVKYAKANLPLYEHTVASVTDALADVLDAWMEHDANCFDRWQHLFEEDDEKIMQMVKEAIDVIRPVHYQP